MDEKLRAERNYPALDAIHLSDDDIKAAQDSWDHLNDIAHDMYHSSWIQLKKDGEISVFSRPSPFPNGPSEFRVEGVMHAPVRIAIEVLRNSNMRVEWDKTLRVFDEIWSDGKGILLTVNETFPMVGGLVSARQFVTIQKYAVSAEGYHISAGMSVHSVPVPLPPHVILGETFPSGWIIFPRFPGKGRGESAEQTVDTAHEKQEQKEAGDGTASSSSSSSSSSGTKYATEEMIARTLGAEEFVFTYETAADLKGSLPKWLVEKAYATTLIKLFHIIEDTLHQTMEKTEKAEQ